MNAAVTVRPGGERDRDFVRELGRRSGGSSVSPVRAARHDDVVASFDRLIEFVFTRDHLVLIAEEHGVQVGFLLLLFDIPDEVTLGRQAFVAYTAVEPFARGRGAGRTLMDAAEAAARARGLEYVSLMVTEENRAARALYDGAGFVTERRMLTKPL
jgi:ribosomal protein S18 acetylase RimI-like enzyme